ncbi:MAG: ABC transporter permease [Bacteroidota bacterium]
MLKNYLKIALRNLRKKIGYTLINCIGLTSGITSFLLLLLFVQDEWSYDKFHQDSDRIYRVAGSHQQGGEGRTKSANITYLFAPELNNVSGIEKWTRLIPNSGLVRRNEKVFQEDDLLVADSTFFEVFSFPLIEGQPSTVLDRVNTAVISESMAVKYFGEKNPIGGSLELDDFTLEITGLMKDFPSNSHFHADMIISQATVLPSYPDWVTNNKGGTSHYTYVKLGEGANADLIEENLKPLVKEWYNYDNGPEYFLQSLESIHLTSDLNGELAPNGDILYTYVFLSVAILILIIACINYMNLAIAKSGSRSKEVGLRKIAGASKIQLVYQHLTESVVISLFAVLLGGLLSEIFMPYFNEISGKALESSILNNPSFILGLLIFGIFIGILTGSYPAFYLSGLGALQSVSGEQIKIRGGVLSFRKLLLVFQFATTSTLLASTLLIGEQISFMSNKKMGVNTSSVLYLPLPTPELQAKHELIKQELLSRNSFTSVTTSNNSPVNRVGGWRQYTTEEEEVMVSTIIVGYDYFETLEAEVLDGRSFSKDFSSDATNAYVLNESAVEFLGFDNPVGTKLSGLAFTGSEWSRKNATVIGVVKDFHFTSMHTQIQPVIFSLASEITMPVSYLIVRYNSNDIEQTLQSLTKVWNKHANGRPIDFTFMDSELQDLYAGEKRFLNLFLTFSSIAIIVACLGALSLISFTVSQMKRQIGIRKVLGAPVWGILKLVNNSFFKIILVAFVVSVPLSYFLIQNWLEDFAYKVSLGMMPYLESVFLIFTIAALTTSFQSLKAAFMNPVDVLKED